MDWEKAKKIFIYLLIMLNILLFALNYINSEKYRIKKSEEEAVYRVLSSNGVGIYCDIIKYNKPMRVLNVSSDEYEANSFKNIFFDKNETVETTLEFDKIIFKNDKKTLEVVDNNIKFYCEDSTNEIQGFGSETARKAAEEFVKLMDTNTKKQNVITKTYFDDNVYTFEFVEMFSGYKIFCNTKKVSVSKKGVIYAEASYYDIRRFVGDKQEICSCDEALLTVMYEFTEEKFLPGRYIENIEMGYDFQNSTEIYDPTAIKLVPCYMIYISGIEKPYKVNAYTNEIIEYNE